MASRRPLARVFCLWFVFATAACAADQARRPTDDTELQRWLQLMVWDHDYSVPEIAAATGLTAEEIEAAFTRLDISSANRPSHPPNGPLRVLPYPGGRHPRMGFLEGAVNPQRETKISVFAPWDSRSYVVVDVPEAIWSNLGLTYLAHTHVATIWDNQGVTLPPREWQVAADGTLTGQRQLPNGIEFGVRVSPRREVVRMEIWLTNGTPSKLTDLRVQNCVLLKEARGFEQQTDDNKFYRGPYAVCHSADREHWIITAWEPLHRTWANARCPCLHSDPKLPDCEPGQTQRARGWLSFYTGGQIERELERIEATGWRQDSP